MRKNAVRTSTQTAARTGDAVSRSSFAVMTGMSSENTKALSALTLKRSKESFVSHHAGTNLTELSFLVALVPCLAFLLQIYARTYDTASCSTNLTACSSVALQFVCVVLPTVLAVTSEALVGPLLWLVLVIMSLTGWRLLSGHVVMTRSLHDLAEQRHKRSGTGSWGFEVATV